MKRHTRRDQVQHFCREDVGREAVGMRADLDRAPQLICVLKKSLCRGVYPTLQTTTVVVV